MDRFTWIKQHFKNRQNNSWNRLKDIIPNIFDEYFLIHWKVGIVDNFPFESYPKENLTIEQTNLRIRIDRKFGLFLNPEEDKLFTETSLKDLSSKFQIPLDYKILNNFENIPAVKILKNESNKALKQSLKNINDKQSLNLYIQDANRTPWDNLNHETIGIEIDEYFTLQETAHFDYCSYLFPDNLEWCLTTSEDLPMFLCIKKELSEKIIDLFCLEIFKIEYDENIY